MKAATNMDQRGHLIAKVVKSVTSLRPQPLQKSEITFHDQFAGQAEWIEEKLRVSLTQAMGRGTGVTNDRLRSRKAWSKAHPNRSRKKAPANPATPDKQACIGLQHNPSLDNLCRVPSFPTDVAKLSQSITTPTRTGVAARDSDLAAKWCFNLFGNVNQNSTWNANAGVTTSDDLLTGEARHAHTSSAVMHPADARGQHPAGLPGIDMLEDMIGEKQLTHSQHSTFPCWHHQDSDLFESIDIYGVSQPRNVPTIQHTIIETSNTGPTVYYSNQDLSLVSCLTTNRPISNTMNTQSSTQSLSELLGDDSRLANMWTRRRSTCPTAEDEAEQLHNMFLHDPDMKLFSPTRKDSAYADTMIFDSYDFSRTSSWSSTSSSPPRSRSSFEQLETNPYSCSKPSTKPQSSSPKQSRMSESDISYQQTSTTRSVDIKKRKNPRDYSSRR